MLKQTATEYALEQIKKFKDKKHFRCIAFKKQVDTQISNYRVTAVKFYKTSVGKMASKEADKLEKELRVALTTFR